MPVPPPEREDRFLRGQLRGQRASRRLGRGRLGRLALFLVLSGAAGAGLWAFAASGGAIELGVQRILVEGNERLSDGEILELIEVDEKTNILTLDLEEVKRKLLRSAWVRDVELKRLLPATLTLQIVERTPVAVAVLDDLYLLAEDGTILDQLPPQYDVSRLVLVRGLRGGGANVDPERASAAGSMAEALSKDEHLLSLVSELDVSGGARAVALQLREPDIRLLVSEATMVQRLSEAVPLLSGIIDRFPSIAALDLRFQNRIYVQLNQPAPAELSTSTSTSTSSSSPSSTSTSGAAAVLPGGASF
jgi:cell division septal protein FtsQ